MRWISQVSQGLRAPPTFAGGMPHAGLGSGPVSQHLFNPFALLTPAQITDLRHNQAFLTAMSASRRMPIDRMWRQLALEGPMPRWQYNLQGPPFRPRPQWTRLAPGQKPLPPSLGPAF